MVRIMKNYKPDESALPPLLDKEIEALRLQTIRERKKEEEQERKRQVEVKHRTVEIIKSNKEVER